MEEVIKLLHSLVGFEVVSRLDRPDQVRLIGRILKDRQAQWLLVAQSLLTASSVSNGRWSCDISKQLLLHGGSVKYAWRVIVQAKDVAEVEGEVRQSILAASKPASVEVSEMLLPGFRPGQMRNVVSSTGRGAAEIHKAVVGPMALRGR